MLKLTDKEYKAMMVATGRNPSRTQIKKMKKTNPVMGISDLSEDFDYGDFSTRAKW
jgi:hypothetical protein